MKARDRGRAVCLSLLLGIAILLLVPATAAAVERIAVLDLQSKSSGIAADDASEQLTMIFFRLGMFEVVERNQIKKILDEQAFGLSGAVDASTAARVGKILGVPNVVIGNVLVGGDRRMIEAKVSIRVVDSTTAVVKYADTGQGYDITPGEAISKALDKIEDNLRVHYGLGGPAPMSRTRPMGGGGCLGPH